MAIRSPGQERVLSKDLQELYWSGQGLSLAQALVLGQEEEGHGNTGRTLILIGFSNFRLIVSVKLV